MAETEDLSGWIEGLTDYTWVFDLELRAVSVDPRVSARTLQRPEEVLDRTAWQAFPERTDTVWGRELRKSVDGRELLSWIRRQPAYTKLPVVLLSASHLSNDINTAFASGANGYVIKPSNSTELVERLKDLVAVCTG